MKFGIALHPQHPAGEPMAPRFGDYLALAREARDYGFASIVAGQHYLSSPFQMLQPIPFLARIAAEAGDMAIGVSILLLPLHHPVAIAEQIATLDVICRGRFIFGVGLGYRQEEDAAFGVRQADKVGRFVEALEIIKRLWTGEPVTFEGQHFRLSGAQMTLRPVQRPHPPIWIAANSDAAVRRAAQLGDTWVINPHANLATLVRQTEIYRRALAELGKPLPPDRPIRRDLYIAEDAATAWREAKPYIEGKYQAYVQWGQGKALPQDDRLDLPFEELVQDRFIVGDPDQCVEQISRYQQKLGVNHMLFRLPWPGMDQLKALRTIKLLGERVLPHFS